MDDKWAAMEARALQRYAQITGLRVLQSQERYAWMDAVAVLASTDGPAEVIDAKYLERISPHVRPRGWEVFHLPVETAVRLMTVADVLQADPVIILDGPTENGKRGLWRTIIYPPYQVESFPKPDVRNGEGPVPCLQFRVPWEQFEKIT